MTRKAPAAVEAVLPVLVPGELVTFTIKTGPWKGAPERAFTGYYLGEARTTSGSTTARNVALDLVVGDAPVYVAAVYLVAAVVRHDGNYPARLHTLEADHHAEYRRRVLGLHTLAAARAVEARS